MGVKEGLKPNFTPIQLWTEIEITGGPPNCLIEVGLFICIYSPSQLSVEGKIRTYHSNIGIFISRFFVNISSRIPPPRAR